MATTPAYVGKRRAEGLTGREIRRCLEPYLALQFYRALNAICVEHGAA